MKFEWVWIIVSFKQQSRNQQKPSLRKLIEKVKLKTNMFMLKISKQFLTEERAFLFLK